VSLRLLLAALSFGAASAPLKGSAKRRFRFSWAALSFGAASAPLKGSAKRLEKESAVKPGSVLDSHSSEDARRRATLATYPEAHVGHMQRFCRLLPYLVLLQVGFAVPLMLPSARCALTAPFHPYRRRLRGT